MITRQIVVLNRQVVAVGRHSSCRALRALPAACRRGDAVRRPARWRLARWSCSPALARVVRPSCGLDADRMARPWAAGGRLPVPLAWSIRRPVSDRGWVQSPPLALLREDRGGTRGTRLADQRIGLPTKVRARRMLVRRRTSSTSAGVARTFRARVRLDVPCIGAGLHARRSHQAPR